MRASDLPYTPGPWRYADDVSPLYHGLIALVEHSSDKKIVGVVSDSTDWVPRKQWEANARLISAAPDLFGAVKELLRHPYQQKPEWQGAMLIICNEGIYNQLRAAIKKAEGKA